MEGNYALIMGRSGSTRSKMIFTIVVAGERCLPLFESAEAAGDFMELGGLDDDWTVFDDPDSSGAMEEFLRWVDARGLGKVVVNPPMALKDVPVAVSPILIKRFLED